MSRQSASILPGSGLGVKVLGNEKHDIEYALKLLKKKVRVTGILDEVKERKFHEKPSVARRKVIKDAVFNQMLEDRKSK